MWSRVLGLSSEKQEDSSPASKKRKDDTQPQRKRTESTVTSTSARKPTESDERDRKFNPTSTSYSSASRSPYPGAASASVASSYATASSNNVNATIPPPDLVRKPSLANKMPKVKGSHDERDRGGDRDGKSARRRDRSSSRDRKSERQDRSRSRDREERKKDRREKRERKRDSEKAMERGLEKSEGEYKGTTRAGDVPISSGSFNNQIGGPTFTQFPGQYDGGMIGPSNRPPHPPAISDHVPDQFPGQFPSGATAPYRPPLSVNQGGPGLAADYYGDTGESVSQQPGVRPQAPSLIVGAEPHLMAASPIEAPPIEPSATGGVGAAASFFSGASFQSPSATPMPGQQSVRPARPLPQSSSSGQPGSFAVPVALAGSAAIGYMASTHGNPPTAQRPSNSTFPPSGSVPTAHALPPTLPPGAAPPGNNYHSASAPIIPTLGSAAVGAAAGYIIGGHASQQHQSNLPPSNGGTGGYGPANSQQSSSQFEVSQDSYSGTIRPPKPGKSSPPSNIPLYAAGAVGAAGLAAAAYHHNHQSQSQTHDQSQSHAQGQSQSQYQVSYTGQPHASTTMVHQHRHPGPLDKFVDFFRDPEGVARFEEYTEYIGVCRYCFEPGSSPRDAPRKHHFRKRRSNERLGASMRVDKESRYGVPDGESRRKKSDSWLATGLAGYGLAKVGKTLFSADSDDDRSARTGHANYSTTSLHGRRYSNSPSRRSSTSYGVIRKSSDAKISRRSRSRSRDRKNNLAEAAVGAAIGASVVAASSQSKQRDRRSQQSPKEEIGVFGGFFSSPPEPEQRRSSHKKSKKKRKNTGFFNFGNSSSTSSDSGFVAGTGSDRPRRKKSSKPRIKDHNDANAALVGLGAAATALAAAEGRKGDKGKRRADVIAVKEIRYKDGRKNDREKEKRNDSAPTQEDTIWVDASDEDGYSSVDSMLAYGLSRRRSQESLSSNSSGTSKWGWRWGLKPEKKRKKDSARRESKLEPELGAVAGLAGVAAGAAIVSHEDRRDRRDPAVGSSGSLPPLQHVHPVSTLDPSHYDVTRHNSITSANQPYQTSRPAAIPLQQPQPVAPISSVIYTSQAPYDHAYSAPAGPPIFSQQHQPFSYTTGYVFTPQVHPQIADPRDLAPVQELRRRDTSPSTEAIHIEPKRPKRASTDLSSARFDVMGKQEDTMRKEERHERTKSSSSGWEKDRRDTRDEIEAIERQTMSKKKSGDKRDDKPTRREEEIDRELERLRKEEAELSKKKKRDSRVEPVLVGVAGAVVGAAAAAEVSKSEHRRERRSDEKERQRAAETRDQQLDEAGQKKSDEKQAAIAKKAAALVKQTPRPTSHESYVDFFVPIELQSKSKEDTVPKDNINGGNDITAYSAPEKIPAEPAERSYPFADPYAVEGGQFDPKQMKLPWPVPSLNFISPTPPASMAGSVRGDASPSRRPEDIHSSDDERSPKQPIKDPAKDPAKVKVTFGESETREYEVITPEDHRDEFIDPSHDIVKDREETAEKPTVVEAKATVIESPVEEIKRAYIPGQFEDDIDFAATLAAGVEASGFDPAIVIDNPTYHRRESPPGSDSTGFYRTPYFETVTDLGLDTPVTKVEPPVRGFVVGELPPTPKEEVEAAIKDKVRSAAKYEVPSTPKSEVLPKLKDEVKPYVARPLTDEEAVRTGRRPEKNKEEAEKIRAKDPFFVPLSSMSRNPPRLSEAPESSHPYSQEPEVVEATPRSIPHKTDYFNFDFGEGSAAIKPTSQPLAQSDEFYDASESPRVTSKEPKSILVQKLATDVPLPGNDDDEWTPTPRSETKSEGRRSNSDGDESDSVEDVASTATTAPLPDLGDESKKHKRKSKRRSSGYYDDTASVVSAPAKYDDSRGTAGKSKKEKKGGLFGLFSKSAEPVPEKETARDDFGEPKRKGSKKSRDRISKRDSGDFYSQPSESVADLSRAVEEGMNGHSRKSSKDKNERSPRGKDERSSRDKDERRKSRKSSKTEGDSGRATQELPSKDLNRPDEELDLISEYENDPGEGTSRSREQEEPPSFLGVRREETEPPDLAGLPDPGGSDSRRMSVETAYRDSLSSKIIETSLPPLPPSRPTTPTAVGSLRDLPPLPCSVPASPAVTPAGQRRGVSQLQLSEASPTAVPLMFRRFPTSTGVSRSSPSTPGQSPQVTAKLSPRNRQNRPHSTEFKSSKEFRPLWLVERHATDSSRRKETPEEVYPSLPSSHSNSRASSVHDPNEPLERWAMDEDDTLSHEPPQIDERDLEYRPDLLDSQQATPTKDSFQLAQANGEARNLQHPSFPEAPSTQDFESEAAPLMYGLENPEELPSLPESRASSTYGEQSSQGISSAVVDAAAGAVGAVAAIATLLAPHNDQEKEQQAQTASLPKPDIVQEVERSVELPEADMVEPATETDPYSAVKDSTEDEKTERIGAGDTLKDTPALSPSDELTFLPSITASQPLPLVEDKQDVIIDKPQTIQGERTGSDEISRDEVTLPGSFAFPEPTLLAEAKEDPVIGEPGPIQEESVQSNPQEWSVSKSKKSKKDKKGKGKGKNLGLETPGTLETSQEETPAVLDIQGGFGEQQEPAGVPEDYFQNSASSKQWKKAKKGKGKIGGIETSESPSTPSATQDDDTSQPIIDDWSAPSKSKKGKKGKAEKSDALVGETLSVPESSREVTDEVVSTVEDRTPPSLSKKGKKAKKGKDKSQTLEVSNIPDVPGGFPDEPVGPSQGLDQAASRDIPDVPGGFPDELAGQLQGSDQAASRDIDHGAPEVHAELDDKGSERVDSMLLQKDISDRTFFGTTVAAAAAVGAAIVNSTPKKDKKRKEKKGTVLEERRTNEPTESQASRVVQAEQDDLPPEVTQVIEKSAEPSIAESLLTQNSTGPAEEQERSASFSAPNVFIVKETTEVQEIQPQPQQHNVKVTTPADIGLPSDDDLDLLPALPESPPLDPQISREVDKVPPNEHNLPSDSHKHLPETNVPLAYEPSLQEAQPASRQYEDVPVTFFGDEFVEDPSATLSREYDTRPILQEHHAEIDMPVQPIKETTPQEAQSATTEIDVVPESSVEDEYLAKDHFAAGSAAPQSDQHTPSITHEHIAESEVLIQAAKGATLLEAQIASKGLDVEPEQFIEDDSIVVKDFDAVLASPSAESADGEATSSCKAGEIEDDASIYSKKKGKKGKKNRKSQLVTPLIESLPEEPEATRELTEALETAHSSLIESSAEDPRKIAEEDFVFQEQPSSKKKGKKGKKQKVAFEDLVTEDPQPELSESSRDLPAEPVETHSHEAFQESEIITPKADGLNFPITDEERALVVSTTTELADSPAEEVGNLQRHLDKGLSENIAALEEAIVPIAERSLPTGEAVEELDVIYSMPKSRKDKKKRKNLSRSDSSYLNAATMEPSPKTARTLETLPEKFVPPSAEEVLLGEASSTALPEGADNELFVEKARDIEASEDRSVRLPETQVSIAALPSEGSELLAEYYKPTPSLLPPVLAESSDARLLNEALGKPLPADDDSNLVEENRDISLSVMESDDRRDLIPSVQGVRDLPSPQHSPLPNILDEAVHTPLPQDDRDDYFEPQEIERELKSNHDAIQNNVPSLPEATRQGPQAMERVEPSVETLRERSTSSPDQADLPQQHSYFPHFDPIFDDATQTSLPEDDQDDYFEHTRESPELEEEFNSAFKPSEDKREDQEMVGEIPSVPHFGETAVIMPVDIEPSPEVTVGYAENKQVVHFDSAKAVKRHHGDQHKDFQAVDAPYPAEEVAVTKSSDAQLLSQEPVAPAEDANADHDLEETVESETAGSKKKGKKDKKGGKSKALGRSEEAPAETSQEQSVSEHTDEPGIGAKLLSVVGTLVAGSAATSLLSSKRSKKDKKKGKSKAVDRDEEPAAESSQEQSTSGPAELAEAAHEDISPNTLKELPAAVDDDPAFLGSTKTKKGKKKGMSSTPIWDEESAPGAAEGEPEAEPATGSAESELETSPPVDEPAAKVDDFDFVSSKRSKKDKKKSKSKAADWEEETAARESEPAIEPEPTRSVDESIDDPTPTSALDETVPLTEHAEFVTSKKGKKDKKKGKSKATGWEEESLAREPHATTEQEPESIRSVEESSDIPSPAPVSHETVAVADDAEFLISKKSKKDKKEKQASTADWDGEPSLQETQPILEPLSVQNTQESSGKLEPTMKVEEAAPAVDDTGYLASKKSKKDKKKGRKGQAYDWTEGSTGATTPALPEILTETLSAVSGAEDVRDPDTDILTMNPVATEPEPETMESFSLKKSKKEKKKAKKGALTAGDEESEQIPTAVATESNDKDGALFVPEKDLTDVPFEQPMVGAAPEEAELDLPTPAPLDELETEGTEYFSLKKSKKGKKNTKKDKSIARADEVEAVTALHKIALTDKDRPIVVPEEDLAEVPFEQPSRGRMHQDASTSLHERPMSHEAITEPQSKTEDSDYPQAESAGNFKQAQEPDVTRSVESAQDVPDELLMPFETKKKKKGKKNKQSPPSGRESRGASTPLVEEETHVVDKDLDQNDQQKGSHIDEFSENVTLRSTTIPDEHFPEPAENDEPIGFTRNEGKIDMPTGQAELQDRVVHPPEFEALIGVPVAVREGEQQELYDDRQPQPTTDTIVASTGHDVTDEVATTTQELSMEASGSGLVRETADNDDFGGFTIKKKKGKKGKKVQKAESPSRTPEVETPAEEEPTVAGDMESTRDIKEVPEAAKANPVLEEQGAPAPQDDFLGFGTIKRKKSKKSQKQAPVIWEDETATPALIENPNYAAEVNAGLSSQPLETLYEGEPFTPLEPSYQELISASDPEPRPGIDQQLSYGTSNQTPQQGGFTIPSLEDILREEDAVENQERDPDAYEEIRRQAFERELEAATRGETVPEDNLLSPSSARDQSLHVVTDQLSVEQAEESLGIGRRRSGIGKHRKGDHSPAGRHSSVSSSSRSLGLLPGDIEHSPHSPASSPRSLGLLPGDMERAFSPHPHPQAQAHEHDPDQAEEASLSQDSQHREVLNDDHHLQDQREQNYGPDMVPGQYHEESRELPTSFKSIQSEASGPYRDVKPDIPVNVEESKQLKNIGRAAAIVPSVGAGVALFENLARKSSVAEKDKGKKRGSIRRSSLEEPERGEAASEQVGKSYNDYEPALVSRDEYRPSIWSSRVSSLQEDLDINRDSAVHISDSPMTGESARFQHNVRDSGYQGTEASPIFPDSLGNAVLQREYRTSGESFVNTRDPQSASLRDSGTTFDSSTSLADNSENPLNISIEVDPAYEVSISRPEAHGHQTVISDVRNRDSGEQLPVHYQEHLARDSVSPIPSRADSQPSPVDSSTKPRSSELFQSSPSTREDLTRRLPQQQNSPSYGVSGHQEYNASTDNFDTPTKKPTRQELPRSMDIETTQGPSTSLFGGPVGINSDIQSIISPPSTPLGSSRRQLNTISEHSLEERALQKRLSGSSDMSLSEHGLRTRRRSGTPQNVSQQRVRSPLAAATERVSIDDLDSRLSWPAVDEETHSVDLERSKSRNTDSERRTSSRLSQSPLPPLATDMIRHHEADYRSVSGASIRSNDSITAIIRDQDSKSPSTPSLRRVDRSISSDLRAANKRSEAKKLAKSAEPDLDIEPVIASSSTYDPLNDKGKARITKMADVYEGWGDVNESPRSPTRPASMRKRQSMQFIEMQTRLEQLALENRSLIDAKTKAERNLEQTVHDHNELKQALTGAIESRDHYLKQKDDELNELKRVLEGLHNEVSHLTEVNANLQGLSRDITSEHEQRYTNLASEHTEVHQRWQHTTRELEDLRDKHASLSGGLEGIVQHEVELALASKNAELQQMRHELDAAKQQIRVLQQQILAARSSDDVLVARDEDYFDTKCQELCQHVQQWVLRFSKFSDSKICHSINEVMDEKIADRFDNAILDGSDVDIYLKDRIRRRDVFMSVVMTMVWEYIFTRYLFGMDREQRQKLKSLEKTLSEVGSVKSVNRWRATTLTMLAKREAFKAQRQNDTEAVVHEIYDTLATLLAPPPHLVTPCIDSLRKVMATAVDLSIEMRTQRAEYIMLPPLQPEYDTNGDLAQKVHFNAALMNERSGDTTSNEELMAQQAIVRMVLFPLVVKKGDDEGVGDEEIVVCPAQVLVARDRDDVRTGKKTVRMMSPQGGVMEGVSGVNQSVQSFAPSIINVPMEGRF